MYCYNVIDKISNKANLQRYISQSKLKCKKCGGELCVYKDTIYICPKCQGEGSVGNVFTAIMDSQNIKFVKAVEYLAEKENVELKKCTLKSDDITYEKCKKCEFYKKEKEVK